MLRSPLSKGGRPCTVPNCGYSPLPADAPCCYVCGHAGPYSTQPPSITKRGLPRLTGQCPRCLSLYTTSGKEKLKNDIPLAIALSLLSFGFGSLFVIPWVLWDVATKKYVPTRYLCNSCQYVWDESELKQAAREERTESDVVVIARMLAVAQEKRKLQPPRRMALVSLVLVAIAVGLAIILASLGARLPQDGQPASSVSSTFIYLDLGILVLGCILLLILWIWVIRIAWQRGQSDWVTFLVLAGGLALPLYLIRNPVTAD